MRAFTLLVLLAGAVALGDQTDANAVGITTDPQAEVSGDGVCTGPPCLRQLGRAADKFKDDCRDIGDFLRETREEVRELVLKLVDMDDDADQSGRRDRSADDGDATDGNYPRKDYMVRDGDGGDSSLVKDNKGKAEDYKGLKMDKTKLCPDNACLASIGASLMDNKCLDRIFEGLMSIRRGIKRASVILSEMDDDGDEDSRFKSRSKAARSDDESDSRDYIEYRESRGDSASKKSGYASDEDTEDTGDNYN